MGPFFWALSIWSVWDLAIFFFLQKNFCCYWRSNPQMISAFKAINYVAAWLSVWPVIGRFLILLGDKFSDKSNPNIWCQNKQCWATFWATVEKIRLFSLQPPVTLSAIEPPQTNNDTTFTITPKSQITHSSTEKVKKGFSNFLYENGITFGILICWHTFSQMAFIFLSTLWMLFLHFIMNIFVSYFWGKRI